MKQTPNDMQDAIDNKDKGKSKQAYTSPHLVEYGAIAKLTQGSSGPMGDGGGGTKQP